MKEEYEMILDCAIEKWGYRSQSLMAIEEMAELTKELCKDLNRDGNNLEELQEEVADVLITVSQIARIVGQRQVDEKIDLKMSKLKSKLDK